MSKRLFWSYEEFLNLKEAIEQQWSNSIPSTRLGNQQPQFFSCAGLTNRMFNQHIQAFPVTKQRKLGECREAQGCSVIGYITPRAWVYGFRRIPWRRMVVITNSGLPCETGKRNFKQGSSHVPWDSEHWIFILCSVRCPKCLYFG